MLYEKKNDSGPRDAPHHAQERDFGALGSIVEEPFIEDGEQGVEDGTVGFEDLIDEGNAGFGQVAFGVPFVLVSLQSAHGEGAKKLLQRQRAITRRYALTLHELCLFGASV